jgi:small conductance mechanosensitive channel
MITIPQLSSALVLTIALHILYSAVIVLVAIVCKIVVATSIEKFVRRLSNNQRIQTIKSLLNNAIGSIIYSIAVVTILSELGVNILPIITGAGILGLAVAFGAQTLVKDVVTGFFIIFEGQFNVGDRVTIAGVEGVVQELNLRTTIVKTGEGNKVIISNSQITTVTVLVPEKLKRHT